MTVNINKQVERIPDSKIREIMELGYELPDVIPLWFGEGDDPTPDFIKQAAVRALEQNETFYVPNSGIIQLRKAISEYMEGLYNNVTNIDRITVTTSGMHGIMLAFQAIISPGDKVVVIGPIWPNAGHAAEILGAKVKSFSLRNTGEKWELDLTELFHLLKKGVKALFINSPNNPTGWVANIDDLEQILVFCRERGIWLICDDVYARLVYDDYTLAPSFMQLIDANDRVIVVNSFSKSWNMTGWRLGWLVAPPDMLQILAKLTEYNIAGPPTFVQFAGVSALRYGEHHVEQARIAYNERRNLVCRRLSRLRRITFVKPQGAFYIFFSVEGQTNSLAFAKMLLSEAEVGLAPGIAFGENGEGYLRLCFARKLSLLNRAIDRLEELLD